jgi:hypothetical protein
VSAHFSLEKMAEKIEDILQDEARGRPKVRAALS